MTDMLSLFDERQSVPVTVSRLVPVYRVGCPFKCGATFGNFPAFLGHLSTHQPVSESRA